MTTVGIVVVTYNSADVVSGFLESLEPGAGQGVEWDLVVVDNASQDATIEVVLDQAPWCQLVQTGRNAGYAAGINVGVHTLGRREAYLIVNADVRLAPGCLSVLVDEIRRPGVGIAVPRLDDARGELILSLRREPSLRRALADLLLGAERAGRIGTLGEVVSDPGLYTHRRTTDWAEGSTQLVSRACWDACGPWDESFFLYSEETDFDLRARDAGFSTSYQPAARATHLEGGSAGAPGLWALLQMNRVRLFARRHDVWSSAAFWAATVLRESSRALLGRPQNRAALLALVSPRRMRERPGPHSLRTSRPVARTSAVLP